MYYITYKNVYVYINLTDEDLPGATAGLVDAHGVTGIETLVIAGKRRFGYETGKSCQDYKDVLLPIYIE